jgi:hypothetical protein
MSVFTCIYIYSYMYIYIYMFNIHIHIYIYIYIYMYIYNFESNLRQVDVLAGNIAEVTHDTYDLEKQLATKNRWEEVHIYLYTLFY